ncbi:Hypothetical predicted protein, partial [Paramuricea clavata]
TYAHLFINKLSTASLQSWTGQSAPIRSALFGQAVIIKLDLYRFASLIILIIDNAKTNDYNIINVCTRRHTRRP